MVLLVSASGSSCWRTRDEILPQALPPTASRPEIIDFINRNTSLVHSVWSTGHLEVPGAPSIPVTLALEPLLRFRLKASTAITGTEVDLGSNDDLFWIWARRQQPPALYFCRHDQFLASSARSILPVEPEWIIEAFGLVRFNPADVLQGPSPVGANRLQIRSVCHSPAGDMTKTTVIDARSGAVLEQHLYDARGTRIASAITTHHHRDPTTGAILPEQIEIQCPNTQLDLHITIDHTQVNTLGPGSGSLWTKPSYPGFPEVNLAQPGPPIAGPSQTIPPPNYGPPPGYAPANYAPAPNYAPSSNYGSPPPNYGATQSNYGVAPGQPAAGYRTYP